MEATHAMMAAAAGGEFPPPDGSARLMKERRMFQGMDGDDGEDDEDDVDAVMGAAAASAAAAGGGGRTRSEGKVLLRLYVALAGVRGPTEGVPDGVGVGGSFGISSYGLC